VVSGTTGWNDRFTEISDYCKNKKGTIFYASNFSIGVNILFTLNNQLARIMDSFTSYSVSMEEVHHIHKLDAPSGTAITLADQITNHLRRVKNWNLEDEGDPSSIHIHARREGEVKGHHAVRYESEVDVITLSHEVKSRDAFASGALLAASFIKDRSGIFGMTDLLKL
jgi:4-hydroxy-tetrahydrodipicolinate reductase